MFMKGAQITFGGLWKNVAPSPRRWFLITSSDVAEEIGGVFIPKIRKRGFLISMCRNLSTGL